MSISGTNDCKPTNHQVAIKVCRGKTSSEMLEKEYNLMLKLDSEFIPKVFDFKADPLTKKSYLIMELIEGNTLEELMSNQITPSTQMVYSWMMDLTKAIGYLHSLGVAHRDIKPQNIMITKENKLKLIDFGIAANFKTKLNDQHLSEKEDGGYKFCAKFFTQIMSPLYAAPEILSSDCYDESVDIWGIGIIFSILNRILNGSDNYNTDECSKLDTDQKLQSENFQKPIETSLSPSSTEESSPLDCKNLGCTFSEAVEIENKLQL